MFKESYLESLKKRASTTRVFKKHQLFGLQIASLLHDEEHRSLYMKLAKEKNAASLMQMARDVADRRTVKNKGGYYMRLLQKNNLLSKKWKKEFGL